MADLGAIGSNANHVGTATGTSQSPRSHRHLDCGSDDRFVLAARDLTFGDPAPSLKQIARGTIQRIYWRAAAGARSLSVKSYFVLGPNSTLRPRVIVKANQYGGLMDDVVTTVANTPSTWITTTVNLTLVRAAVLEVWLEQQSPDHQATVWWDTLVVS